MTRHYLGELRRAGGGLVAGLLALMAATTAGAQSVTIDFVTVGHANNPADPQWAARLGSSHPLASLGSVAYDYRISATEVTNSQYTTFLNAVFNRGGPFQSSLYSGYMRDSGYGGITSSYTNGSYVFSTKPGYENLPVVFVHPAGALQFVNWLHNGQGAGGTDTGAYNILQSAQRQAGATYFLPNASEWYKAAFYLPANLGGPADGWWQYATRSDVAPNSVPLASAASAPNAGNFYRWDGVVNGINDGFAWISPAIGHPSFTPVGSYSQSASGFGTFDQAGNVLELLEFNPLFGSWLNVGGSFAGNVDALDSSRFFDASLSWQEGMYYAGFRVAAAATPIPEPSTYAAFAALASLGLAIWRRRRVG